MEESLKSLFKKHLPGLRLRALEDADDAFLAERILNALYLYSVCHAEDVVSHPAPRALFLKVMSVLMEQGYHGSYKVAPTQLAHAV